MCTRYASWMTKEDWVRLLQVGVEPPWNFQPSYNVTLTTRVPVVMLRDGQRVTEIMRWGIIPAFHKGIAKQWRGSTYNTRDDNVEKSGLWKHIWKRNRCLIPVSGFYEWHWTDPNDKKEKPQPYYFTAGDGAPMLVIAGIFDRWKDPENDGRELLSFSMMTTAPNAHIAKVHDRLVVTLRSDQFGAWLDGSAGKEMLAAPPDDAIRYWPVSKRINPVKAPPEDRTLIEPVEVRAQSGDLFGNPGTGSFR